MELGGLYQTIGKGLLIVQAAGASFTQISRGLSVVATRTSAGIYVMTLAQPVSPAGAKVTASLTSGAAGGSNRRRSRRHGHGLDHQHDGLGRHGHGPQLFRRDRAARRHVGPSGPPAWRCDSERPRRLMSPRPLGGAQR